MEIYGSVVAAIVVVSSVGDDIVEVINGEVVRYSGSVVVGAVEIADVCILEVVKA